MIIKLHNSSHVLEVCLNDVNRPKLIIIIIIIIIKIEKKKYLKRNVWAKSTEKIAYYNFIYGCWYYLTNYEIVR